MEDNDLSPVLRDMRRERAEREAAETRDRVLRLQSDLERNREAFAKRLGDLERANADKTIFIVVLFGAVIAQALEGRYGTEVVGNWVSLFIYGALAMLIGAQFLKWLRARIWP
jgi:hypothetical protein